MSKPLKRGGRYYARRRVPLDLVDFYGRKEIQKALNTSDRTIATMLCAAADTAFNEMFAQARATLARRAVPTMDAAWSRMQPEEWGEPEDNSLAADVEDERARRVAAFVDERLRATMIALGLHSPNSVNAAPAPFARAVAHGDPAAPVVPLSAPVERTLSRLVDLWEKARKPDVKTAEAFRRAASRFEEYVGDLPVPRITKAHVVTFKDKLFAADHTATTVRSSLSRIQTLLKFAIGQAWVETNAAEGVKVDERRKHAKAARPPFDTRTLNNIFASRVYTEGYRPTRGAGEAVYWLPLLGLFTGARIEELCQLRPEDVYEEQYRTTDGQAAKCWVLRITEDEEDGLKVKNHASVRRVPLHPELLARGFIGFVEAQRGTKRIFNRLRVDRDGRESTLWAKWWIPFYLRKECAPTSPKMVFHSFRHSFKDICRECGINKEAADALQGHSEGDSSGNYGSEFYPLRPLVEAIERYQVHGVTLPPTAA